MGVTWPTVSTFMLQSGVMKITIVIGAGVLGLTGVFLTSEARAFPTQLEAYPALRK